MLRGDATPHLRLREIFVSSQLLGVDEAGGFSSINTFGLGETYRVWVCLRGARHHQEQLREFRDSAVELYEGPNLIGRGLVAEGGGPQIPSSCAGRAPCRSKLGRAVGGIQVAGAVPPCGGLRGSACAQFYGERVWCQ